MSSVHCVVVWEFQSGGHWVPHTPGVTRTLERAHAKKLTRVVLADADPALKGHYVNLRTLTQSRDMPDGGTAECDVRRSCYSVQSVGGRGARWEWARLSSPPLPAELHYEPMPMEVQCVLEDTWLGGGECVQWEGWLMALSSGLARRAGAGAGAGAGGALVRVVRRAPQPPYPLTRPAAPTPPQDNTLHTGGPQRAGARIPHQHTGSSVYSVQSAHAHAHATHAHATRPCRAGARSASPRDRKPNLARQILHNLNIFSHNKQVASPQEDTAHFAETSEPRADTESSTHSTRRHSVDTVSTYLSHESKDSMQRGSVGELLNCSAGSDDVFESPTSHTSDTDNDNVDDDVVDLRSLGVGVGVCSWVRSVACPQWGAVCPVCMRALGHAGPSAHAGHAGGRAVSLAGCRHMLHLHCLRDQLLAAAQRTRSTVGDCVHRVPGVRARVRSLAAAAARARPRPRPRARACARGCGRGRGRGRAAAPRQHGVAAAARAAAAVRRTLAHTRHIHIRVGRARSGAPGAGRALLRGGVPAALPAARRRARPTDAVAAARVLVARRVVLRARVTHDGARVRGAVARARRSPARLAAPLPAAGRARAPAARPVRASPHPAAADPLSEPARTQRITTG